jgi:Domain of Unknown Function (DUF1080)
MFPKPLGLTTMALGCLWLPAAAAVGGESAPSVIGRWDVTVKGNDGDYPAWFEVRRSGRATLVGSFVGQFGSARPISRVELDKGRIRFCVPPQWEDRKNDLCIEGMLDGDALNGQTTDERGRRISWSARRAPSLKREQEPKWGEPVELFNGKDLTGWKSRRPGAKNSWTVRDGLLANTTAGNDLLTEKQFTDFQLHAEFRYPRGSNSGIYLRGRYEVQIEDNFGQEHDSHGPGAVYGFLTPSVNAARRAGEWQTLDITLVGRIVTVALNGERILDRQAIPGITGGALDSNEGGPGPILIQGDHGPIDFRRLTITPAK